MARGFKKDKSATLEALATGILQDRRSFISMPKAIPGECDEPRAHLLLYGADKGPIRSEIFRRNREENRGFNRCWKCGDVVYEHPENSCQQRYRGQWHHVRNKDGQRCDCDSNGVISCGACHKKEHPQVKLREVVQV